jgi:hypothetical protein
MPEFVANPPWYVPIVLGMSAIVLLFQGNNRQNKHLKTIGLVLAVVGIAVVIVGKLLESDREQAERLTQEVGRTVNARDWAGFDALLDPKVKFLGYPNRQAVVDGSRHTAERLNVSNVVISGVEITEEPGTLVANLTATADVSGASYRLPTNWRFYWGKNDNAPLTLYRIEYVPNPNFGTDQVLGRFVK